MKIVAIVPVFNDEDVVSLVLENLISQKIEPVVLDNGSTDGTLEKCKKFAERDLISLIQYKTPVFEHGKILKILYDLALTKNPDWIIKNDSDEIFESGQNNVSLRESIEEADSKGYNLIQFDNFEFFITDYQNDTISSIKKRLRCYSWQSDDLYRAWKYFPGIEIDHFQGHYPVFPDNIRYKISPRKLVSRHYRFRNQEQIKKKIENSLNRISGTQEQKIGTHSHWKLIHNFDFTKPIDHKMLTEYKEDNDWNYEWKFHPFLQKKRRTREEIFTNDGKLISPPKSLAQLKEKIVILRDEKKELREKIIELRKKVNSSKIMNHEKYKEYSEFKKLLENKKVCLVGPAEYVDKEFENHGKIIDSYDVVIKINNFINTDESLFKNYGKRMDILITSLWYDFRNTYCIKESYSKENINKPLLIFYRNGRLDKLFLSFFELNDNISFCEQPKKNLKELKIERKGPTTGTIAIFEILKCHPKELYVTGLTLGMDLKHKSYVDRYYKFWTVPKITVNKDGFSGAHNMKEEFNFVKKLIQNNSNLTVDSYLSKEIFHLE